jgi:hypothetical protein
MLQWESCEDDIEGANERDVEPGSAGFLGAALSRQLTKGKSCNDRNSTS